MVNETGKNSFGNGFLKNAGSDHYNKRRAEGEYIDITEEQYIQQALRLLEQEVGGDIDGFITKYGKIVRWDKRTNDYAIGEPGVKVSTMFKLHGGLERFEKLRMRDGKKEDAVND